MDDHIQFGMQLHFKLGRKHPVAPSNYIIVKIEY